MATNYNLIEVSCQKAVSGDSFGAGTQDYPFSVGRPNAVNMARSYFKVDLAIEDKDGKQAPVSQLIALADNCVGNLYTNVYFRGGGQEFDSCNSFLPQASQLKRRLGRNQGWLQTIGQGAFSSSASQATRIQASSNKALQLNVSPDYQKFYKGSTNHSTTQASITGASGAVAFLVAPQLDNFASVQLGDAFVLDGCEYTVVALPTAAAGTNMVVSGATADVAVSTDFYFIRRNAANTDLGKNTVSILWQPPLGVFDNDGLLGAGDYRISLTPSSDYRVRGVETSNLAYYNTGLANYYRLNIKDVKFYAYYCKAEIPPGIYNLGLMEMDVQAKPIVSGGSNSLSFSVPPSTMYLTIFVQSSSAGSSSEFPPSMFKTAADPAIAVGQQSGDTTLESLQIAYASINKPSTRWTSEFKEAGDGKDDALGNVNKMTQRYYDSFLEMNNMANGSGGVETFGEWVQRGPFYHFVFARDMTDRSTEVQININFRSVAPNTQCFLASHYHRTIEYTVSEGMITSVASKMV